MSDQPLEGADEYFAKLEAQRMLLDVIVAHITDSDPGFPAMVVQTLDDAPPYVPSDTVVKDVARSLRIRERAQALLREDMLEFQQARRQKP